MPLNHGQAGGGAQLGGVRAGLGQGTALGELLGEVGVESVEALVALVDGEVREVLADAGEELVHELGDLGALGGGAGTELSHERAPSGWVAVRVSDRRAVTVAANASQSLVWVESWARPEGVMP